MKKLLQTRFSNKNNVISITTESLPDNERAVCPWCTKIGTLGEFREEEKLYKCPNCGARSRLKTLKVFDSGPEYYSRWVWARFYEARNKRNRELLKMEEIIKTVKEHGFADTFWNIQKEEKSAKI